MKTVSIIDAKYIDAYKIELFFNDKTSKVIDFGEFLLKHSHPAWNKYKNLDNFKKFKLHHGNIVWGRNWNLMFHITDLYKGYIC